MILQAEKPRTGDKNMGDFYDFLPPRGGGKALALSAVHQFHQQLQRLSSKLLTPYACQTGVPHPLICQAHMQLIHDPS